MLFGCAATPQEWTAVKATGFDYIEVSGKVIAAMEDRVFFRFVKDVTLPVLRMNAFCPADVVITGPGYNREHTLAYSQHLAQRAGDLGVQMIGIGSPMSRTLPQGFSPAESQREVMEFLQDVSACFAPYNIRVCLEPLATCYCNTVNTLKEAVDIVRRLGNPNIGVVLDFYNMEHMNEAHIDLTPFSSTIIHAHISDDDGSPKVRSYLKPEKKALHQQRITNLLLTGYQGNLTLEIDVPHDSSRAAESLTIMKEAASSF